MIKSPINDLIVIPKTALPKIKEANESELKTLLYFFAEPESSVSDAARRLGLTIAQVDSAIAFWRGAGIFENADAPKKKTAADSAVYRNYDSETLSTAIESNGDFALVCQFAGERLGKQLTKNDLSSLFYLFDYVNLPAPVLCGIIEHCCAKEKKSVQYIFKKALALYDEGIDTYDKFESYLARLEQLNSNIGRLRRLFGMGDRELSAKESKTFSTWFSEWGFSFDTVKLAFEKTVDNKGSLNINYMNGILRSWKESGFETPEDVAAGEAKKKSEGGNGSSFETDEFIEAALSRGFE